MTIEELSKRVIGKAVLHFQEGCRTMDPTPATVLKVNQSGSLDMLLHFNGMSLLKKNVLHIDDPEIQVKQVQRQKDGAWDFCDERPLAVILAEVKGAKVAAKAEQQRKREEAENASKPQTAPMPVGTPAAQASDFTPEEIRLVLGKVANDASMTASKIAMSLGAGWNKARVQLCLDTHLHAVNA